MPTCVHGGRDTRGDIRGLLVRPEAKDRPTAFGEQPSGLGILPIALTRRNNGTQDPWGVAHLGRQLAPHEAYDSAPRRALAGNSGLEHILDDINQLPRHCTIDLQSLAYLGLAFTGV